MVEIENQGEKKEGQQKTLVKHIKLMKKNPGKGLCASVVSGCV